MGGKLIDNFMSVVTCMHGIKCGHVNKMWFLPVLHDANAKAMRTSVKPCSCQKDLIVFLFLAIIPFPIIFLYIAS